MDDIDRTLSDMNSEFNKGFHPDICPVVFAVLGKGRVASGVIYALERIPHETLSLKELKNLFDTKSKDELKILYKNKIIVTSIDMDEL